MILGLLLGVALAVLITSSIFLFAGVSGASQGNVITGAAIGTSGVISYAIIFLILSLVAIFFIVLTMKSSKY